MLLHQNEPTTKAYSIVNTQDDDMYIVLLVSYYYKMLQHAVLSVHDLLTYLLTYEFVLC